MAHTLAMKHLWFGHVVNVILGQDRGQQIAVTAMEGVPRCPLVLYKTPNFVQVTG
jgi:hypothetical protein